MLDVRLLACGCMLVVSAYYDLRTREVDDRLWEFFGVLGIFLTVYEYFTGIPPDLLMYVLSFAFMSALAYALYYVGLYGGADAKALAVIVLLVPFFDVRTIIHPIAALIVLTNSAILTIILPIYCGLRNFAKIARGRRIFEGLESEPLRKKILASLFGYRTENSNGKFLFRLERIVDGKRTLDISTRLTDEEFVAESGVWVTPGIPLLLFMAIGFLVMVFFGDILALIINILLRIL